MDLTLSGKDIAYTALVVLELNQDLKNKVNIHVANGETCLAVGSNKLVGASVVTRYLLREAGLLDERVADNQYHWHLIDLALSGHAQDLVKQRKHTFLIGDDISLVDYIAWALLPPGTDKNYEELVGKTSVATAVKSTTVGQPQSSKVNAIPSIPGVESSPESVPYDAFRNVIASQLASISGVDAALIYRSLEAPRSADMGDFAVAIPRLRVKGNPTALAQEWSKAFVPDDYVTSAEAVGVFLNFRINALYLVNKTLQTITEMKETYGTNSIGKGKLAIVEYSSPNIAKPFHAGHLRSTIIGAFVANVLKANGWEVTSMNYLGDWGKQYGLLAIGYEKYGNEEELKKDPIKHLYNVYVEINKDVKEDPTIHDAARAYFKRMEDGDEAALSTWRRFRDLSIVKYRDIYERLNITFDVYSGESQVGDGTKRALALLHEMNLLTESENALVIDLKKHKLGTVVVQKSDGTPLYITRDLGAAIERYEKFKFDKMVYVISSQQDLHVKQFFKTLELLGYEWVSRCEHITYGMVLGMSTRKGSVVFLEDILDNAQDIMHEVMKKNEQKYSEIENPMKVADEIGISAVKIQDNAARRIKNYEYDAKRMYNFEGDTGPYIQYAHARLFSIERKSGLQVNYNADTSLLVEEGAKELVQTIAQYPDIVKSLVQNYEPCTVVTYLFKLSQNVASVFDSLRVRGADPAVADARLLMFWAARVTLGNAMRLLGLRPMERM